MRKPPVKSDATRAPWLRLWRESLHNSKFRSLSHEQRSYWLLLLLMTDARGTLPALRQIAYNLQTSEVGAQAILDDMIGLSLIDITSGLSICARTLRMHDWDQWQPSADDSKERMRRHRAKGRVRKHREKAKRRSLSDVTVTLRDGRCSTSTLSTLLVDRDSSLSGKSDVLSTAESVAETVTLGQTTRVKP